MKLGLSLSDQEFHALYCPVKNTKSALFFLACFSVVVFGSWKGLHKAPEHPSFVELLFAIAVVAMLAKWLMAFTCFRERLVLSLVIVSLVTGEVQAFIPSIFGQYAAMVESGQLALSLLGLLACLTMLVQSLRAPRVEPNELEASITRQLKRNSLILFAVVATILVLCSLLYFFPFRR